MPSRVVLQTQTFSKKKESNVFLSFRGNSHARSSPVAVSTAMPVHTNEMTPPIAMRGRLMAPFFAQTSIIPVSPLCIQHISGLLYLRKQQ